MFDTFIKWSISALLPGDTITEELILNCKLKNLNHHREPLEGSGEVAEIKSLITSETVPLRILYFQGSWSVNIWKHFLKKNQLFHLPLTMYVCEKLKYLYLVWSGQKIIYNKDCQSSLGTHSERTCGDVCSLRIISLSHAPYWQTQMVG